MNLTSSNDKNIRWLYCNTIEDIESYKYLWQECLVYSSGNLFNSFEWIIQWKNTFWNKNWSLHLYIAFDNDRCVLLAPFYIQKNISFPFVKYLYLLGQGEDESSEISSEYQDIFIDSKYDFLLLDLAKSISSLKFDIAKCGSLLENANVINLFSVLKNSIIKHVGTRFIYSSEIDTTPSLSKNNKSKLNKSKNKLTDLNAEYLWVKKEKYDEYWELLKQFHQTRWNKLGKKGAFFHTNFSKFHNDFRKKNTQYIKMSAVLVNNTPIAIHYYFSFNNILYFYQSGWDEDNYANTSPGFTLHVWSMNNCTETYYDFMMGSLHNSYKAKLGCNHNSKIYNITLVKNKLKIMLNNVLFKTNNLFFK